MGRAMMVPALALEVRAKNRNAENKVVIIICFTSFKILDIRWFYERCQVLCVRAEVSGTFKNYTGQTIYGG
ncbi:MAG: hypothetical protein A3I44_01400 [Candidatus Sungbacteria bacterium RIFCSPLOWO2_02_FULL_51_17]|nr:MAG: hypothetical protein A2676_00825 [Candidatus Sungbacteria bacterium RIFCSPHIGHO2_01_FULL_51_22]OHA10773.1 MAG: hypothetical protein A3I44_01400 [Candidatus Sungbacteria bacterium RIFCSPLOWO2_02_FULL_51_17]